MKKISISLFFTAAFLINIINANSQNVQVNINELTEETQKTNNDNDEIIIVWWIPATFWHASLNDPNVTEDAKMQIVEAFDEYTVMVITKGNTSVAGNVDYKSKSEIVENISITDYEGNTFKPISPDDISLTVTYFVAIMKPVFTNMLGPMGENLHFIFFPK